MHRRLFGALIQDQQRQFGLSTADYEVLVNLFQAPTGRMRAFELCESIHLEKSRLSHHLKRLEQRGLVKRESTDNARFPNFMLTEAEISAHRGGCAGARGQCPRVVRQAIASERLARFTETARRSASRWTNTRKTGDAL